MSKHGSTRPPYVCLTLSPSIRDAPIEDRLKTFLDLLEACFPRAKRFTLHTDELFWGSRQTRLDTDEVRWEEIEPLENAPRWARMGCGCLGLLFKPLYWLGLIQGVRELRVQGPITPQVSSLLKEALQHYAAYHLVLDGDRCQWVSWDVDDLILLLPAEQKAAWLTRWRGVLVECTEVGIPEII